jgi:hypothetical protein
MYSPRQMDTDNKEENRTNKSPTIVIKTPERSSRYYIPSPKEASNDYERNRVAMYPTDVHTDITSMVPRCTTTDLDLHDALNSPKKETWLLNHHKLRCLACMWSPSDKRRTGSTELDNKSDFFFVTKYGKGLLPTNMYLTLCKECMYASPWTSFPVSAPQYIKYGTLKWKLAQSERAAQVHGERLRIVKPAGVPDLKPKTKKTLPNKRLKYDTEDWSRPKNPVARSPLSNLENNLKKIGSLFNI